MQRNTKLALNLGMIVAGMVMLAYASVPLYDLFCRVTGFGGTTQVAAQAPGATGERLITVRFNADTDPNLPWSFRTQQNSLQVRLGEQKLAFFHAENKADHTTFGTAIYNVTPNKAGIYFNKIQCFCFVKQPLEPHQSVDMPVSFFIDPEFMKDPDMDDVDTITLSYTFFPFKE